MYVIVSIVVVVVVIIVASNVVVASIVVVVESTLQIPLFVDYIKWRHGKECWRIVERTNFNHEGRKFP